MRARLFPTLSAVLLAAQSVCPAVGDEIAAPAGQRFSDDTQEAPHFRKHVVPLLGRLGCNGRACHGSFQGQGGFQLSLFGYDFAADHKNLMASGDEGQARVNLDSPADSLVLKKPSLQMDHEGGQRMQTGSWQYRLLERWIAAGAIGIERDDEVEFVRLNVTPAEIVFSSRGEEVQLTAVVHWSDGSQEDVTPLCRFKTNNEQVAAVDENGKVTSVEPGDTHVVAFFDNGVAPVPVLRPVSKQVGDKYPDVPTPTKIDELVVQKLRKLGIVPSELASDADFLRRLSLDLTGTLPGPQEVEAFLADASPDKRTKKIDELLARPAYASWWATKLCDFTGLNDQALVNVVPGRNGEAGQQWYAWIRKRVEDNVAYDKLAEGIILGVSRNDGESYTEYSELMSKMHAAGMQGNGKEGNAEASHALSFADRQHMPYFWARRNLQTPQDKAVGFAYSFMGIRIQCAQCHKHPFDQWTKRDFDQFANFFTGVSTPGRGVHPEAQDEYEAILKELGVENTRGNNNQLQREFVNYIRDGKTVPYPELFAIPAPKQEDVAQGDRKNRKGQKQRNGGRSRRAAQARLLGDEVVDLRPLDDIRSPLMDWLRSKDNPYFARAFVNRVWANYFNVGIVSPPDDLSLANPPSNRPLLDYLTAGFIDSGFDMKWLHREIVSSRTYQLSWRPNDANRLDETNFSRAVPRRIPAEVAVDAIAQATASNEEIERLAGDASTRSISYVGTQGRNNNRGGQNNLYALTVFGRSTRESNCDCDRSSEPSLLQTVYLQNDRDVQTLLDRAQGGWLSEISKQYGLPSRAAPAPRKPDNYDKQIAQLRRQIEKLKQARDKDNKDGDTEGDNEASVKQRERNQRALKEAQARLAQLQKRFEPSKKDSPPPDARPLDMDYVIRQAYLRTLSRYPDDGELARSRQHVEQAENKLEGVRDLLWALLNTKEFIVNH
jgi:hypothetical protein